MKRVTKLHFGDIGKSFSVAFVAITVVWGVVSYYSFGGIYLSWQILLGNLAASGALSALYYRFRYHRLLEYDDDGFTLRTGTRLTTGVWRNFSCVSLYHRGFAIFVLRLYRDGADEQDFLELPATDLGLDASDFRFEAARLVGRR